MQADKILDIAKQTQEKSIKILDKSPTEEKIERLDQLKDSLDTHLGKIEVHMDQLTKMIGESTTSLDSGTETKQHKCIII